MRHAIRTYAGVKLLLHAFLTRRRTAVRFTPGLFHSRESEAHSEHSAEERGLFDLTGESNPTFSGVHPTASRYIHRALLVSHVMLRQETEAGYMRHPFNVIFIKFRCPFLRNVKFYRHEIRHTCSWSFSAYISACLKVIYSQTYFSRISLFKKKK